MRNDRRARLLAICFSGVAGYVDAIGFLLTGGFFVSFMNGNSTRLGIGMADAAVVLAAMTVITAMTGPLSGRDTEPS